MSLMKIIIYIVAALGLLVIFRVGNVILHALTAKRQSPGTFLRILPVVELIVWLLFALWLFKGFFSEWQGYTAIMIVFTAIIFGLAGWYFFRDFIAGVVLKAENPFTVNQHITTSEITGTIKKVGYRTLEVGNESGRISKIPYSRLSDQVFSIQPPAESTLNREVTLKVSSKEKNQDIREQIVRELLLLPWVSVNHDPVIQTVKEDIDAITLKISYHTLNDAHALEINRHLRKRFEEK